MFLDLFLSFLKSSMIRTFLWVSVYDSIRYNFDNKLIQQENSNNLKVSMSLLYLLIISSVIWDLWVIYLWHLILWKMGRGGVCTKIFRSLISSKIQTAINQSSFKKNNILFLLPDIIHEHPHKNSVFSTICTNWYENSA